MSRYAGRIVWRELVTPAPPAAKAFYTALFDWSPAEMDMGGDEPYLLFLQGEQQVGGVTTPQMDGVPPHWLDYITVDDVDATLARVVANGGTDLTGGIDVPGVGRIAVAMDPTGAAFGVMTSPEPTAPDAAPAQALHDFCWSQLASDDPERASSFYAAVLGWQRGEMPNGMPVLLNDGQPVANVVPADGPSHWLKYVAVDDTDAAFAKAVHLGARPLAEPSTVPDMGRFAILADPTGAAFALWKDLSPTR